ncbi:Calpain-1 catalytic subunit [Bagarius yarrelli]|uniref:Calpain-1 catalytic subunit n=1 Tax=Bagarius yarrelli TaxID=175774 RepID=A0A556UF20_BAGYA|nr:Calpain-1 catalytic subunit [Bagarius yarrelli]
MPDLSVMNQDWTDGVGSRSKPERFLGQSYNELWRDFVKFKARFLDDKFPPNESSIGDGLLSDQDLARKMVADPQLVVSGESRFDLAQGELGNCWFLAAIGAITFQPEIMDQVIPEGQSFKTNYAGIFHFRVWRFGKWVDVVIDDKLPTIDGQLIFVHCKTRNEFWPALLEKAYAKYDLFIQELDNTGATSANTELPNGIVEGHAYTVTGVTKVMSDGELVKLVRLLNPWGHKEWKGDWSDRSALWWSVDPEERTKLLENKENGEFWMSVEDFCRSFASVDICCQSPAFLDGSSERSWTTTRYEGHWDERTAGGSMENKQSFWMNPQYLLKIPVVHSDNTEGRGFNLLLRDQSVFPAPFFSSRAPVAQTKVLSNSREVMEFLSLKPGVYLVVPFTYKPKETGAFVLTLYCRYESCESSHLSTAHH